MSKMDDENLLHHLQSHESDASSFTWGRLSELRERNLREYFREPYGTEQEGLSGIVTSEVQDTIEWILPDLLDIFVSSDKAVCFDPVGPEDVKSAEQATDSCNYVFYKQNNGFLILETAFRDALTVKNCAVMWRKETKDVRSVTPVNGATEEMLTMVLSEAGEGAKIEAATPLPPSLMPGPDGAMIPAPQTFNARISRIEKKTTVKVEAFQPENLLIKRDWTSPILTDCPYVCRVMPVTLSEIHEMGYTDVTAEELRASDDPVNSTDAIGRHDRHSNGDYVDQKHEVSSDDESQASGYLRIEFVLVDFDGDGIAERRCIYRLKQKILKNEEISHVPISTGSPILIPHRWEGMSLAEIASDLQLLSTEITRQMIDAGRLALNPRTKVLTEDIDGVEASYANLDDLLDSRPGGIIRQRRSDATQEIVTPWAGGQMFPMLEYKDEMLQKRTGVSGQSQGIDANALNRGGAYETRVMNAAQKRIKLMARVLAETVVKPIFQGILKLLTEGGIEKLSFRLRNEFVQFDPNEWRDSYDMTINVGLGNGDKMEQIQALSAVAQAQAALAGTPFGPMLVTPKHVFNTQARLLEYSGFKDVENFWNDPKDAMPQPPSPMADPRVAEKQMELMAEADKFRAEYQMKMQLEAMKHQARMEEIRGQLELQAQNDQRDASRETLKAQFDAQMAEIQQQLDKYKVDQDNATRIAVAQISHAEPMAQPESEDKTNQAIAAIAQALQMLAEAQAKPRSVTLSNGRTVTVQ